jgi:hypothetical protein
MTLLPAKPQNKTLKNPPPPPPSQNQKASGKIEYSLKKFAKKRQILSHNSLSIPASIRDMYPNLNDSVPDTCTQNPSKKSGTTNETRLLAATTTGNARILVYVRIYKCTYVLE